MTAVEWLIDYIKNLEKYPYKTIQELEQQAKEMEKQQIIDAYNKSFELRDKPYSTADKYYTSIYGSKGSDEHIVDTNEMIYPKTAFEILQPKLTIADTLEFREKHLPEILDAMEEYATYSQTEISDEKIEIEGWKYCYENKISSTNIVYWITACKWYREQLKQINDKTNG